MGAAGDMLTAALLELQDDPDAVIRELNGVFAGRAVLSIRKEQKCGITGSHVTVEIGGHVEGEEEHVHEPDGQGGHHGHHHHHHLTSLAEVRGVIGGLALPETVVRDALAVYDLIAEAEARVHGASMENIHFHEVGSLDAMADVVSVCYLMHLLAPDTVCASPVHVGSGTVRCAHGELPVPAPATQELLKGIPIYGGEIAGELCTPTGAALLKYFVKEFGPLPPMRVSRTGLGLGTKDFPRLNGLRVLLGESDVLQPQDRVVELACSLDDMTAEDLGFAMDALLAAGALDVSFTAIGMKKNRPGVLLRCLCHPEQREEMLALLFRHTSSLGIREYVCNRYTLSRSFETRETPFGPVRIKRSEGYGTVREKPEFEDLKKIAEEQNLSLREVREKI